MRILVPSLTLLVPVACFAGKAGPDCNEKVRLEVTHAAALKCPGGTAELRWAEQELGTSRNGKRSFEIFSVRCRGGKVLLGLVPLTFPPGCEISPAQLSHTSEVPRLPVN